MTLSDAVQRVDVVRVKNRHELLDIQPQLAPSGRHPPRPAAPRHALSESWDSRPAGGGLSPDSATVGRNTVTTSPRAPRAPAKTTRTCAARRPDCDVRGGRAAHRFVGQDLGAWF